MFWQTSFHNTVATAIPADLEPQALVSLLHDHSYFFESQPLVTRWELRERERTTGKMKYDVWETISLLPFGMWPHEIRFAAAFTDTPDGVASRVDAPLGFVSDATYTVRQRRSEDKDLAKDDDEAAAAMLAGGVYVLEERIYSQCPALFKWFVQATMVSARRKMHSAMIVKLRHKQRPTSRASDSS